MKNHYKIIAIIFIIVHCAIGSASAAVRQFDEAVEQEEHEVQGDSPSSKWLKNQPKYVFGNNSSQQQPFNQASNPYEKTNNMQQQQAQAAHQAYSATTMQYAQQSLNDSYGNDGRSTLGITNDEFISQFKYIASSMNEHLSITTPPQQKITGKRNSTLFCMGNRELCFNTIWSMKEQKIQTVAMIFAGDGSKVAAQKLLITAHAFIGTINPDLTYAQRDQVLNRMGFFEGNEAGSTFQAGQNGVGVEYSFAHSSVTGTLMIAIAR